MFDIEFSTVPEDDLATYFHIITSDIDKLYPYLLMISSDMNRLHGILCA